MYLQSCYSEQTCWWLVLSVTWRSHYDVSDDDDDDDDDDGYE